MRILILEDDPLIALDLELIVEGCGHEVVGVCGTLAEMRDRISETPDFCFLDVDLPDGKSYDLALQLDARHIPFTFVSGSRPREMPDHLRHAAFIPKPYSRHAIRSSLEGERRIAC